MKIIILNLCLLMIVFSACSSEKTASQTAPPADHSTPSAGSQVQDEKPKETATVEDKTLVVESSKSIIGEIWKKKSANPAMSAKELADYGNEMMKKSGYDFTFDWTPKGKENEANLKKEDGKSHPYFYEFTDSKGNRRKAQLMNHSFEHPCFSTIDIPVTKVNDQTMTIISKTGQVELKRPADFKTEEFVLLDESLKKEIRKWKVPFDATPVGISEDGKKVYFETYQFNQDITNDGKETPLNLAIEVSEDGSLRLVDLEEIKSGKGESSASQNKDEDAWITKYTVGNNEYFVKAPSVCS